jgi:hypothetical protein
VTLSRALACLAVTLLASCREPRIGAELVDITVQPLALEFGRVLENDRALGELELFNPTRIPIDVRLEVPPPFFAPGALRLSGGERRVVQISFLAGNTEARATLEVTAGRDREGVALHGTGVRPLNCVPSQSCRVVRFDLQSNTCIETLADEGADCVPDSLCQVEGKCQAGVCRGKPKICNDGSLCTDDGCSEQTGCEFVPILCPPPTRACHVATCAPLLGCGEAPASDLTVCGAVSCERANLCFGGSCLETTMTDGLRCAPRTACRDEAVCAAGECVAPDAGVMVPDRIATLRAVPQGDFREGPVLTEHRGNLYWTGCASDGGCQLVSYTPGAIDRFHTPFTAGQGQRVVAVTDAFALVAASDALEAYAPVGGAALWRTPLEAATPPDADGGWSVRAGPGAIAVHADGRVSAALSWSREGLEDAGVENAVSLAQLDADGGLLVEGAVPFLSGPALACVDADDALTLYGDGGLVVRATADAGLTFEPWGEYPGVPSLVTSSGALWVGATTLLSADAGVLLGTTPWVTDAGVAGVPLPGWQLSARGHGFGFFEADGALWLRRLSLAHGQGVWDVEVTPAGALGEVVEARLVAAAGEQGVAVLSQEVVDGGVQAHYQLFALGEEAVRCEMPPGGTLAGAHFDEGTLHVLVERDGGWLFERYLVPPLPADRSGWPERGGLSGTRRERP